MLCFRNFAVAKRSLDKSGKKGGLKVFRPKFFFSRCQKIKSWKPSLIQKVSGLEIF